MMTWLRKHLGRPADFIPAQATPSSRNDFDAARAAVHRNEDAVAEAKTRRQEISELAARLSALGSTNHFAELWAAAQASDRRSQQ